ncbi:MAG: MBL fold metallo-hydrolase [Bacteroidales bacterium]|nr:MBL fold metallo-hydrolase [Bacteroidales bacterium]
MIDEALEIEFLGTGTSTGVPSIGCDCEVCRSTDPHDNRLRASAVVRYRGMNILIDCGPDFRQQILRASSRDLDALLITHIHYDHVAGIDDLRPYSFKKTFPVYAREEVNRQLRINLPYCFAENPYPGVPRLELVDIADAPFMVGDVEVTPIPVMHHSLRINGYRIGPLAYITDCSHISAEEIAKLKGMPLLVINALRHKPHHSHMTVEQALEVVKQIAPREAYFTHMCHGIGLHAQASTQLPPHIHYAHDTLVVTCTTKE